MHVLWLLKSLKHNITTSSPQHGNDSINTQWAQTDYTLHLCQKLSCSVFYCVAMFRRPEGKFKKKQNPRDEALQILRPQMDNPPAPQVDPHTWKYCNTDFSRRVMCICWTSKQLLCVCPAQTSCRHSTIALCSEGDRIQTQKKYQEESTWTPLAHSSPRYSNLITPCVYSHVPKWRKLIYWWDSCRAFAKAQSVTTIQKNRLLYRFIIGFIILQCGGVLPQMVKTKYFLTRKR